MTLYYINDSPERNIAVQWNTNDSPDRNIGVQYKIYKWIHSEVKNTSKMLFKIYPWGDLGSIILKRERWGTHFLCHLVNGGHFLDNSGLLDGFLVWHGITVRDIEPSIMFHEGQIIVLTEENKQAPRFKSLLTLSVMIIISKTLAGIWFCQQCRYVQSCYKSEMIFMVLI